MAPGSPELDAGGASISAAAPAAPSEAGSREGGRAPPGVAAAIDAFDASLAAAVCKRLDACCSQVNREAFFQLYTAPPFDLTSTPSSSECAAVLATQLGKLHERWAASMGLRRIKFDAPRAASCVAGIDAAACGVPLVGVLFDAACFGARNNEVFAKVTPIGAACQDIKDGTFYGECDPKLGFCGSSGTCEVWRKTGETCGVLPKRMFCAPALSCEGGSPSQPGTCSGPPVTHQAGESCAAASGPLELCVAGTYCHGDTGKCAATKADGTSCQYDEECVTNHPYSCTPFGGGTCGSDTFCNTTGGK